MLEKLKAVTHGWCAKAALPLCRVRVAEDSGYRILFKIFWGHVYVVQTLEQPVLYYPCGCFKGEV